MTAKELAEKSGKKLWKVYELRKKLGRLPTVKELVNCKTRRPGRPNKYISEEQ